MLNIAVIALESSADQLGAYLIYDLKKTHKFNFFGAGGNKVKVLGFKAFYSIEDMSYIGIWTVIKNIRKILRIKQDLYYKILANKPNLIIGIDSSSFNLKLERSFKQQGIPVIHYVSPQVWAWRAWRAKNFHSCFDLLLLLYPFELDFYKKYQLNTKYVGYPNLLNKALINKSSNINKNNGKKTLALLPGSRVAEITYLMPLFLQVAAKLAQNFDIKFILPMANNLVKSQILAIYNKAAVKLDLTITDNSHQAMLAAGLVLCASGTAALESMLFNTPAVVCYKTDRLSAYIAQQLITVKFVALPNLLANKEIFPELLQYNCTVANIYQAVSRFFQDVNYYQQILEEIKLNINKLNSNHSAAQAVLQFIAERKIIK